MSALRLVMIVAPLLILGEVPQAGGVQIKKAGADRFEDFEDQELDSGDTIRTGSEAWSMDYGSVGEVWIGEDTDVVYESGALLTLLVGEVVVDSVEGSFEIGIPGAVVVVDGAVVELEFDGTEVLLRRDFTEEGADRPAGDAMVEGDVGFRLWLDEDQTLILIYDAEREATRVFVPEDTPGAVLAEVQGIKAEVLGGPAELQELYIGQDILEIPPGADVLLRRGVSGRLPSEEPPGGRPAGFLITPMGPALPVDEPFEDAGGVLEVANVSPSQPR